MGKPKLSNATYDSETATMFVDVSMSNAKWSKNVGIAISDRDQAKAFKYQINEVKSSVTFVYENNAFVLKEIIADFNGKIYVATLTDSDRKPEYVSIIIEDKEAAFKRASKLKSH